MSTAEKNYTLLNTGTFANLSEKGRVVVGPELGLTSSEISLNSMAAGQSSPFLHSHKLNEEIYIVISGSGTFTVDGETFPIQEGSLIRVAPEGVRSMTAGDAGLVYICIQAEQNSLTQSVMEDGVLHQ